MENDAFILAGKSYRSRLLVGTGKYKNLAETKAVVEASGAEIITVALRRVDLATKGEGSLMEALPPPRYAYLPNSAGCFTADEAIRTLKLARELGGWMLVKLEVIADRTTLYPDVEETIRAARTLARDGFHVMAYTTDDLAAARRLEDAGCAAVMPLASPIGSGLGIRSPEKIAAIAGKLKVPVLVDAGIGTASDATIAMELGCAGVLLNSALAGARQPVVMARAMKAAVEAGRLACLAGRMAKRETASASSPQKGTLPAA
ncbi:MAG: thiazole synthase [Pseudomonadota bacterium]|nr:thiazole synthase [Pseudomonadota bacterium]MDE3037705.1 thiazole synthase [Pseudomonadota bacterium]